MKSTHKIIYKKFAKGFTLIELLVVVVIIGILATIALPQYKYVIAKTKFAQLLTATKALKDAQTRYMLLNGGRSADLSVLDVELEGGTFSNRNAINDGISFDWGYCAIADYKGGKPSSYTMYCLINKPYIIYFVNFYDEQKICCASKSSGDIGKKICQTHFPNATGRNRNDYCGTGGTLYDGY